MTEFSPDVVAAILRHMNGDHTEDNLVIVRAFGAPEADSAIMTGLDGLGGEWEVVTDGVTSRVRVPWSVPITERAEIRREVVVLHDAAAAALGLPPRAH